tara:strand:- start:27562 stop:28206 length:645 start_codon:yes stop_codon:yes gene_type:complete
MAQEQVQVNQEMVDYMSTAPYPTPGQSLTNSPDHPQPWERPPTYTTMHDALYGLFETLTEEDMLQNIIVSISNNTPIEAIAKVILVDGFEKGAWNPDLLLQLVEPTMYMVMSIAEKAGIHYRIDEEDSPYEEELDGEQEALLLQQLVSLSADRIKNAGGQINLPTELKKELKELDLSEVELSESKGTVSETEKKGDTGSLLEQQEPTSLLGQRG